MSFALPIVLILIAPLGVVAWLLLRGGLVAAGRLPGEWRVMITPALKRYVAGKAAASRNHTPFLALAIAAMIVLALARPGAEIGDDLDLTGIAGRVIVLDASTDVSRQALFVRELEEADPTLPTAIIAAGADAYLIVPFTTDPVQTHRYLNVLTPDMMPGEGRRLHLGLALAEQILARAGYPAGQIILTTDQPPPQPIAIAPSATIRTVAAVGGRPNDWEGFAGVYDAEVIDGDQASVASAGLMSRAREEAVATLTGAGFDLSPWLIGGAMMAWLMLFRRREA